MQDKQTQELDLFAAIQSTENRIAAGEVIIGSVNDVDALGTTYVDFPENPSQQPLKALTTLNLSDKDKHRQVALMFEQGDLTKPIVMGLIHSPLQNMIENFAPDTEEKSVEIAGALDLDKVQVEGGKMTFEAEQELVFKCGESSITLTKAGKVMIRGKYLLNRSSGVNRIMGGSVQVN